MMIKAIDTKYKGFLFRSRLEARWAVFFDVMNIDWEYESEGYDVDGVWYLPDFRIGNNIIEIKPMYSEDGLSICYKMAEYLPLINVLHVSGLPCEGGYKATRFEVHEGIDDDGKIVKQVEEDVVYFADCRRCDGTAIIGTPEGGFMWGAFYGCTCDCEKSPFHGDGSRTARAYNIAKSYRF